MILQENQIDQIKDLFKNKDVKIILDQNKKTLNYVGLWIISNNFNNGGKREFYFKAKQIESFFEIFNLLNQLN